MHAPLAILTLQVVRAVAVLHSHGICHGDLQTSNILGLLTGMNGLSEEELMDALGEPELTPVSTYVGKASSPSTPKYLVAPIDFDIYGTEFLVDEACIIDFGDCFEIAHKRQHLDTRMPYRALELILRNEMGIASDLWALGCSIFKMRRGYKLFGTYDGSADEYLESVVLLLGRLPEPWWSSWEERSSYFAYEAENEEGRAIALRERRAGDWIHTSDGTVIGPR